MRLQHRTICAHKRTHRITVTGGRTYDGLSIGPAQTGMSDNDRPAPSLVVLIETVIRLTADGATGNHRGVCDGR
jgi:hypothetical protein